MTPQDIVVIAVPVTAIVELMKRFNIIPPSIAPIVVALIALIALVLYVVSTGGYAQSLLFGYFAAWVAISVSAIGVYEATSQALQNTVAKQRKALASK